MCVCGGGGMEVGDGVWRWGGGWWKEGGIYIFLVVERFLAPCFIELLMFYW